MWVIGKASARLVEGQLELIQHEKGVQIAQGWRANLVWAQGPVGIREG
jgi:hypothetical protein